MPSLEGEVLLCLDLDTSCFLPVSLLPPFPARLVSPTFLFASLLPDLVQMVVVCGVFIVPVFLVLVSSSSSCLRAETSQL